MTNDLAASVIDTYLEVEKLPVPHAILVEGAWGVGKTYFLEEIYEPRRQKVALDKGVYRTPFLFVSLFGATSAADVEMRMHRAASPGEVIVGAVAGTAVTAVGEFFQIKDAVSRFLGWTRRMAGRRHHDYILVFDDLERAEVGSLSEIMGLVNSLITTHKRRVILVGDEVKLCAIHKGANWEEQNEKIVGRRVRIEPDVESVIRTSILMVRDEATNTFMTERLDALIDLAQRSTISNLRNLSWAIANGARLVRALLADRDIPEDHVARVMLVAVATTLWYRSQKLNMAALNSLLNLSMTLAVRSLGRGAEREAEAPEITDAKLFSETFADLNVESPPFEYKLITNFETSGVLNDSKFIDWTKSQFGFGRGYSEPSWRRLWHSYAIPMAATDEAVEQLRSELTEGVHTECGSILHSAGLAIRFQNVGDTRISNGQEVVPFFKEYIDRIVETGNLERVGNDPSLLEYDSSDGLGFASKDTAEFQEITAYLISRQVSLNQSHLKDRANELIRQAELGKLEALHGLNTINDELSRMPVLKEFAFDRVATLIASDVPSLFVGAKLLAYRYHHARHGDPLLSEIGWARQVYQSILEKVTGWPEHHRVMAVDSMQSLIRHYEKERLPEDQIIPQQAIVGVAE